MILYIICSVGVVALGVVLFLALFGLLIAVIFKEKTYIPEMLKITGVTAVALLLCIAGYFLSTSLLVG